MKQLSATKNQRIIPMLDSPVPVEPFVPCCSLLLLFDASTTRLALCALNGGLLGDADFRPTSSSTLDDGIVRDLAKYTPHTGKHQN